MSDERNHVTKKSDEPDVEGHKVLKRDDAADADTGNTDDEPDVEGHAHVKHVEK